MNYKPRKPAHGTCSPSNPSQELLVGALQSASLAREREDACPRVPGYSHSSCPKSSSPKPSRKGGCFPTHNPKPAFPASALPNSNSPSLWQNSQHCSRLWLPGSGAHSCSLTTASVQACKHFPRGNLAILPELFQAFHVARAVTTLLRKAMQWPLPRG